MEFRWREVSRDGKIHQVKITGALGGRDLWIREFKGPMDILEKVADGNKPVAFQVW